MAEEMIRWQQGDDGIVVLTFDDPAQPVNTMNTAYVEAMEATLERLEAGRDEIAGVILTSGKRSFFAGGDIDDMLAIGRENAPRFAERVRLIKRQLRRLEQLGRPVVAAINGTALGGGLELAFAAHRRIVLDAPGIRLGLPEVTLGLLPGAGGVVRSVRMLGIRRALEELLLEGRQMRPAEALELVGIVDELVGDPEALLEAARAWIKDNPEAVQPWDREDYRIPGGAPGEPQIDRVLPALSARLSATLKGAPYPAPEAILAAAVEGAQVDFESAIEIEGRYFISLLTGQTAKNMMRFFFDSQRVRGRYREVDGEGLPESRRVAVLGAGMMGAGIAYVCARAGLEVILEDVELAAAERGKSYSERLVAKQVERGRMSEQEAEELLGRITPTGDPADVKGADVMIEAVFEAPEIKAEVYGQVEHLLTPDALLGSNTSTLPITELAGHVSRPEDFLGLHFFSPVEKMPLLEIIRGERTSEQAIARGLQLAGRLGKTPIVVNDSRGFFTSRVITTFIYEGMAMLDEGIPAAMIEQASSQAGYPAAVLQLSDELNLKLMRRVREAARAEVKAAGGEVVPGPADPVLDAMLDRHQRPGRLEGAGFYEYADGRRVGLWKGLETAFPSRPPAELPPLRDLSERMLFIESLETMRCLEEGVLESVAEANVGSVIGIGFPRWTGGVLQYANGYEGGLRGFLDRARGLAEKYGERFQPPAILVERAERDEMFLDRDGDGE